MTMVLRFRHVITPILWLFLLLIIFHGFWLTFSSSKFGVLDGKSGGDDEFIRTTNQLLSVLNRNRKLLASKFDFTPFLHRHLRQHHRHHRRHSRRSHSTPAAAEGQIDPRYGVDKRLVPTGPNPLHH